MVYIILNLIWLRRKCYEHNTWSFFEEIKITAR